MALPNRETWTDWDFSLKVRAGRVEGVYPQNKYGFNPAIVATTEDIWSAGGILQLLAAAETMNIVSTDVNDAAAGTGAQTVELAGVDDNYNPLYETIALNGTTPVPTNLSFFRINRMRIQTVGSSLVNLGDITATASVSATTQAQIPALGGSTFKSQFTIPEGHFGIIKSLTFGTLNNDQVEADLQIRRENGPWITVYRLDFVESTFEQVFFSPLLVYPRSDIRAQCVRIAGAGTVRVSSFLEFYLVPEDFINFHLPRLGF